jgi:secreted trypsin-like serine protease
LVLTFLPTTEVSTLYYADPESDYPAAGYMLIQTKEKKLALCGVTFISSNTAITAAHCLEIANKLYLNTGEHSTDYSIGTNDVQEFRLHPDYDSSLDSSRLGEHVGNDVGVVVVNKNFEIQTQVQISSPTEGCNYYIVGYGDNEDGDRYDRLGLDTCIDNIDGNVLEISFPEGGFFCKGDSGSAIFRKDTNQIVGLVSSFDSINEGGCHQPGIKFYGTRLDSHIDFINSVQDQSGRQISRTEPKDDPSPEDKEPDSERFEFAEPEESDSNSKSERNTSRRESSSVSAESTTKPLDTTWLIVGFFGFVAILMIAIAIIIVILLFR